MNEELQKILTNLADAGCGSEELQKAKFQMTEYDDVTVRKVVECIRVLSKTEIQIIFKGGFEMNVEVDR